MDQVLCEGTVPLRAELAKEHRLSIDELDLVLKDLEAGIVVAVQNKTHEGLKYFQGEKLEEPAPELGEIFYARPFSSFKNHYEIAVDGEQKWYGECAVEVCGVSAMFPGKEVVVRSICRQTKQPVELTGKDGVLLDFSPKTLRVQVGFPVRYMIKDVVGWCDYNSFFCSEEAAQEWRKSNPEIKGVTKDPVTISNFVSLVGKGRLDFDYKFRMPLLKVLFAGKKYGFTKPLPGLGLHVPDPFWMPTIGTLLEAKRRGYKNLVGVSLF